MLENACAIERTDTALTIRSRNVKRWLSYLLMVTGAAGVWWTPWAACVALAGIGIALWLPREVSTTFDLQTKEVRQTAHQWRRVHHRVIAYGDIESIGFYEPDPTEPGKFAVIRLKQKEQIRIALPGSVLSEKAMNLIAAVTGLPRVDTVYRVFYR